MQRKLTCTWCGTAPAELRFAALGNKRWARRKSVVHANCNSDGYHNSVICHIYVVRIYGLLMHLDSQLAAAATHFRRIRYARCHCPQFASHRNERRSFTCEWRKKTRKKQTEKHVQFIFLTIHLRNVSSRMMPSQFCIYSLVENDRRWIWIVCRQHSTGTPDHVCRMQTTNLGMLSLAIWNVFNWIPSRWWLTRYICFCFANTIANEIQK